MKFDVSKTNMVKCIAIILMLMHHVFGCFETLCEEYGVYSLWLPFEEILEFSMAGKVCVATYVFLTAYGIAVSYSRKMEILKAKEAYEKFCFNRYIKLACNFLFVYIVTVITSGFRNQTIVEIYGELEDGKGVLYVLFDMLGVAKHFGTPTLNETWWYMSIAIPMIFLIPLLVICFKKFGKTIIMLSVFVVYLGLSRGAIVSGYFFSMILGIVFAEENYFETIFAFKIVSNEKLNSCIKLIIAIVLFVGLMDIRGDYKDYVYWLDVCAPILLSIIVMELSNITHIFNRPMNYIGKHSMNIFLIHTLVFEYYFTDFIYGFKYWIFVLLALLFTSLLGSVLIEILKEKLFYNKLVSKLMK